MFSSSSASAGLSRSFQPLFQGSSSAPSGNAPPPPPEDDDDDDLTLEDLTFLGLYFHSGKLGAALYSADAASLSVLGAVAEFVPDFKMTRALLHQVIRP